MGKKIHLNRRKSLTIKKGAKKQPAPRTSSIAEWIDPLAMENSRKHRGGRRDR